MNCLTITLNAAIDATYVVERLQHGGVNRVLRKHEMPGGKGNNVARVLAARDHVVTASGFLGGDSGKFIESGLREAGIEPRFIWLETAVSRTCHTVLEQETGVATEILETGPTITGHDCDRFLAQLPKLMAAADVVVISGSAPAGATPAFLEQVAKVARMGTPLLVVDSSGQSLISLLAGGPDLIKPNEAELRALMNRPGSRHDQIGFVQNELIGRHLAPDARVVMSLGQEGAMLITSSSSLHARAPQVDTVNSVGCGDALLAGFIDGWLDGLSDPESLELAVACGTGAALQEVAGVVDDRDVDRLRSGVDVVEYGC